MARAQGSAARFAYVPEDTWGTTPTTPSMKLLKAMTYGESVGAEIEDLESQAVNAIRAVEARRGGNIKAGGTIPFELAPLGLGTILKHAIGTVSEGGGAGPTYVHTIKRGALPVGLTFEKGFTDLGLYYSFPGSKINTLAMSIGPRGFVTGQLGIVAKNIVKATSALGVPSATTHSPYAHFEAAIQEGGAPVTVTGFTLNNDNQVDTTEVVGSRLIGDASEGKGILKGTIALLFNSGATIDKWLADTLTSLQVTLTNSTNVLVVLMPQVHLVGQGTPMITGGGGLLQAFSWAAEYNAGAATDITVTLTNSEATI